MRLTLDLTLEEYRWVRQQKGDLNMEEYVHQLIIAKREEMEPGITKRNRLDNRKKPKSRFSWEQESGSEYQWIPSDDKYMF